MLRYNIKYAGNTLIAIVAQLFSAASTLLLLPIIKKSATDGQFGLYCLFLAGLLSISSFRSVSTIIPTIGSRNVKSILLIQLIASIIYRVNIFICILAILAYMFNIYAYYSFASIFILLGAFVFFFVEGVLIKARLAALGSMLWTLLTIFFLIYGIVFGIERTSDGITAIVFAFSVMSVLCYPLFKGDLDQFHTLRSHRRSAKFVCRLFTDKIEFGILTAINSQGDKLFIAFFVDPVALGIYTLIGLIPTRISSLYNALAQHSISRIYESGVDVTASYYRASWISFLIVAIPLVIANKFYFNYIGVSTNDHIEILIIMLLMALPQMCGFIAYPYLASVNCARIIARVNFVSSILFAFSLWVLGMIKDINLFDIAILALLAKQSEFFTAYICQKMSGKLVLKNFLSWSYD